MELVTIVTLLAVAEFVIMGVMVGAARGTYSVAAPSTTGDEAFERRFRVHYNTMEQLVAFLPGLWAFGIFVSFNWAAGIGAIYLIGRVLYARGYIADPDKRSIGMVLSVLPSWVLLLGGIAGAGWSFVFH